MLCVRLQTSILKLKVINYMCCLFQHQYIVFGIVRFNSDQIGGQLWFVQM